MEGLVLVGIIIVVVLVYALNSSSSEGGSSETKAPAKDARAAAREEGTSQVETPTAPSSELREKLMEIQMRKDDLPTRELRAEASRLGLYVQSGRNRKGQQRWMAGSRNHAYFDLLLTKGGYVVQRYEPGEWEELVEPTLELVKRLGSTPWGASANVDWGRPVSTTRDAIREHKDDLQSARGVLSTLQLSETSEEGKQFLVERSGQSWEEMCQLPDGVPSEWFSEYERITDAIMPDLSRLEFNQKMVIVGWTRNLIEYTFEAGYLNGKGYLCLQDAEASLATCASVYADRFHGGSDRKRQMVASRLHQVFEMGSRFASCLVGPTSL